MLIRASEINFVKIIDKLIMNRRSFGAKLLGSALLLALPFTSKASEGHSGLFGAAPAYKASDDKKSFKLDTKNAKGWRIVEYQPEGVCSRLIHIEVDSNNVIQNSYFVGGCSGNTKGVCLLLKGLTVDDAISRLSGVKCGNKPTSCPDQLAKALILFKETKK